MEHFRLRKYRGLEVWARVRRAYEAGESGPSVALRFDVGLANLRKRAREQGWCRRHQAERSDRDLPPERAAPPDIAPPEPIDREEALAACLNHASAAMLRGDGPSAIAAVKAAQAYGELTQHLKDPEAVAEKTEESWRAIEYVCRSGAVRFEARRLATAMLIGTVQTSYADSCVMFHWRAEHLGPEVAAADYAKALDGGYARQFWREDGVLAPLKPSMLGVWERLVTEDGKLKGDMEEDPDG